MDFTDSIYCEKTKSTAVKGVLQIYFAFLRGHYPEQVHRVPRTY